MMDRLPSPGSFRKMIFTVCGAAWFAVAVSTPGCSGSQSGEYTDYSRLAGGDQSQTDALPADEPSPQEPDSAAAPVNETPDSVIADDRVPVQATANAVEIPASAANSLPPLDPNLSAPRQAGYGMAVRSGESLPIKLLIPDRQFRKEDGVIRATFDDFDLLKILNMQPVPPDAVRHFPDWLSNLNGARIRVRGFMRPAFESEGLTEFLFVRDNGECCFGPKIAIYDLFAVQLAEGEETDYIQSVPFDVEGTFRIDPYADDAELLALYFLDDAVIIK